MISFLADENFDGTIIRGLLRHNPKVDIVRVQDVGLTAAEDPRVLKWAAEQERVLLTHDVATITRYAYERVREGEPMPGVIEVGATVAVGPAIEDLLLLAECSFENELEGQVVYLPLR